jgi:hypothetical protein
MKLTREGNFGIIWEDGEGHHISLVPVKLKVGPNKATSVDDVKRLLNEPIEGETSSSSEEMVKIHAVPKEREHRQHSAGPSDTKLQQTEQEHMATH